MTFARSFRLAALMLMACVSAALAHGQTVSDLGGRTLCVDATSVSLHFEGVAPARQRSARPELENALRAALDTALRNARVRHTERASCAGSEAYTQLAADVRYLNPKNYVGFGDPAYSYSVNVWVGRFPPRGDFRSDDAPTLHFVAGWSGIHSEARTGRPFEPTVRAWGEEQARDLAVAWRGQNPTLSERLANLPPLWQGAVGLGLGSLLALVALALLLRRRGRPPLRRRVE